MGTLDDRRIDNWDTDTAESTDTHQAQTVAESVSVVDEVGKVKDELGSLFGDFSFLPVSK